MKIATLIFVILLSVFSVFAQTQRNPVLEFCSGTW